ncbi:MAG: sulfotransferase family protein [Acidimicrobiales bacterium]|nr:tetratricopeptide repeat protein [Hyphomonadaceae bacterium]RZV45107.1 MAG: sulfotransferase family protein [Acidimicrobiales bacterium]
MIDLTLENGLRLLNKREFKTVHSAAIELIRGDVNNPIPYFLLGMIAAEHANTAKALELIEKASALDADNGLYHAHRAKILSTLRRQNEAKDVADKASVLEINDAFIADTLGVVYSRCGYHEQAIPLFEKAVAFDPNQANYHYNLGASAQFIGDFKKAKTAYRNTLDLDPGFYRARSSLISLSKQTEDDNQLDALITNFKAAGNDADAQLQLGHAIAKTLEDLRRHPESLDWLLNAKKAKRQQLRYDRDAGAALFTAAKTTAPLERDPKSSASKGAPIFVVGLPRTGTTLVDRILSSHADVISAGELNRFAELIKEKAGTTSNLVMDAETFEKAPSLDLSEIGKAYVETTKGLARGAQHMVDKMPLNFFYAGLIHQALPNARIIGLRRGAMDSCLSNFRQLFSTQYSFYNYTFDLEDTALFYRGFDDLMAHWRETLPADRFMEVRYEDIVFDQENQTRRLLGFCDLPWDEACMRFHENKAPVSTASSVQVRQPLYAGSIGRWKKYGDKLDALRNALGDLADEN